MKYGGKAMEMMADLMYKVGRFVAVKYGMGKVLELADPDTFRAMMNDYHNDMALAIQRPEFRKEAARRTYEALQ